VYSENFEKEKVGKPNAIWPNSLVSLTIIETRVNKQKIAPMNSFGMNFFLRWFVNEGNACKGNAEMQSDN